jgi:hypothetical protein
LGFTPSFHANYASAFHERLLQMINRFDAALDQEHEVGAAGPGRPAESPTL